MEPVLFQADWKQPGQPLTHFWEHTVGSCHAPLALTADWQNQLRRCREELGFRRVRFHGLLCDDMSTLVRYRGGLIYSFFKADRIVDFLLSVGVRPFVELSFMPGPLATGAQTVFHYRGNVTPPRDYDQWAELIRRLAAHWVERYGPDEVREWYFEVWNEPNLQAFWAGTREEYFRLYRATAQALKGVDAGLRVGGPATAKEEWLGEFLDFCEADGLPADFVSTHHYPNDVLWQEDQDTETQLAHSRRGILREWMEKAHRQARGRPLLYTEWNCSSHPRYAPQDEPYAAAYVTRTVLEANGLVDCYSFWTFSDLFEENYFPSVPFHGGFGLLTIHGIPKPNYRAFQLLHRLGTDLLKLGGAHETLDGWLSRGAGRPVVLLTNSALPRHPIRAETVRLRLANAPRPRSVTVERIDDRHANARRVWQEMGAPEYLRPGEVERLEEASRLVAEPLPWEHHDQTLELEVTLPPQSVVALTLEGNGA